LTNRQIDIQELIDLIASGLPEHSHLRSNLESAKDGQWESKAYYRFVDSVNANKSGANWQFKENIIFEHSKYGTIVLDILEGEYLGGIEFIKFI